jgi:hypothetical protein
MSRGRNIWFIARKDVQYFLREKEVLLWLFIMPALFMYFIGTVGGGGGVRGPQKDRLAVNPLTNGGFLATELIHRLEENDYLVDQPQPPESATNYFRRLALPENFTASVLQGTQAVLRLEHKEAGLAQDYDRFRVARASYTVLADLLACVRAGDAPGPAAFARLRQMPRSVTVDVQPAGKRHDPPSGFQQAVPGIMVMFSLIAMLTSGSVSLIVERRQGLLKRLASAPLARGEVFLGKWLGRLTLGLIQIAFAMVAGRVLFRMDWGPDLPCVLLVMLAWAGFCSSFGILLGSLARTEGQAIGVGVLAGNLLAALGGCWWPVEIAPAWMQALARATPGGWTMHALHQLTSFQAGPVAVLGDLGLLVLLGAAVAGIAARQFRFD